MRLLFISNLYPPVAVGGYELNCADVAQELSRRRHEVHVLTSTLRAEEIRGREKRIYRALRLLPSWDLFNRPPSARDSYRSLLRQRYNVHVARYALDRVRPEALVIWNGLHLGQGLLRVCEQRMRVAYYLEDDWLAAALVPGAASAGRLRRAATPIVRHLAGIPQAVPQNDRLIFCSQALRAVYARRGAAVSHGTVIYPGIPTDLFSPRPPRILRRKVGEACRILFSGQVMAHKGTSTLVEALACVRSRPGLEQTRLTLIGDGRDSAYLARLHARIAALGLTQAVDFLPGRPRCDVPAVFDDHDLLVFPSEWEEPFGLSLVEAMGRGLPVVTSARGAPLEIVRDRENAVVFETGNVEDLANKIAWVLTHSQEAAVLGQAASVEVHQRFSIATQVNAFEAFVQSHQV